ncbi:hypothetical protein KAJ83_07960 [Marivibrio halodurans]|uniref:Uncharacterized protein n=1 Tax=Marivibrio halodurans TaxID=2039722 RepID=A0A8J7V3P5_9PROT|nr:hypothetical protein [Marivibrio halodurans]MBP5856939.1 hypothetical protein [Marivibrio halodurans]
MAKDPESDREPPRIDAGEIERAVARGAARSRRMTHALDTVARTMERDPESLARVLRRWMREG